MAFTWTQKQVLSLAALVRSLSGHFPTLLSYPSMYWSIQVYLYTYWLTLYLSKGCTINPSIYLSVDRLQRRQTCRNLELIQTWLVCSWWTLWTRVEPWRPFWLLAGVSYWLFVIIHSLWRWNYMGIRKWMGIRPTCCQLNELVPRNLGLFIFIYLFILFILLYFIYLFIYLFIYSFIPIFLNVFFLIFLSVLPSFLSFFLSFFLPFFLSPFLPSSLPSFLCFFSF